MRRRGKSLAWGLGVLGLAVLLGAVLNLERIILGNNFIDPEKHYHFRYPASWRISTGNFPLMHYRTTFLFLNSMGREDFWVREMETAPGTRQYNSRTIADQLPPGSVYLDIGWWEGPPTRHSPGTGIEDRDLTRILKSAEEEPVDENGLAGRPLEFTRSGHRWCIFIYRREPVSWKNRLLLKMVLRSFRFEDVSH